MTRQTENRRERGVALLFALGLLALMSVLGVAFVTNSLLAKKTAVNIRSRNEAKILLDSAVNRLMMTITAVLHQNVNADLDVVYSSSNGADRVKGNNDNTQDMLNEESGRMRVFIPGQPVYKMSDSKSTWVYIRDAENKVIGRMAYQVLPTGKSSMSLNQVLLGIFNHNEYDANWGRNGDTAAAPPVRSSWNSRIGKDITELNLEMAHGTGTPVEDENGKKIPQMPFANTWTFNNTDFPSNIYKDGYTKSNPFSVVPSFEDFYLGTLFNNIIAKNAADETKEYHKIWFRRWFTDSNNAFPEAFYRTPDSQTKLEEAAVLHRFNLGNIDGAAENEWYNRFPGSSADDLKNNKVIDSLIHDSADFVPGDNAVPKDVQSGIPFLSIIGRDRGSFDNLENRRKQIAANLNDYCDDDSIPTSDVSAADWSGDGASNMPKYTGNEKTPYINELMYGLKFSVKENADPNSVVLSVTPSLKFFAELINIYDSTSTFSSYKVKTWLKMNKENYIKIEVVEAKGEVTLDGESTPQPFDSVSFSPPDDVNSGSGEPSLVGEVSLNEKAFANGYLVVGNDVNGVSGFDKSLDLNKAIQEKFSGKTIINKKLTSFKLKISNIKLKFVAAGLFNGANGVDFVRAPDESGVLIASGENDSDSVTIAYNVTASGITPVNQSIVDDSDTVYLSGIEVRDPRQNLNLRDGNTTGKTYDFNENPNLSDWRCIPKLQVRETADEITIGSMKIKGKTPEIIGQKNSCSTPSAPFNDSDNLYKTGSAGSPGVDYDKEKVEDPAYTDDGTDKKFISTAYIANAPMKSLWELGAIHRGKAWQTINLKRAGGLSGNTFDYPDNKFESNKNAPGISYNNGDAGILDQVKLTGKAYSSGKLDVNMLLEREKSPLRVIQEWDKNIIKALFYNIHYGQQLGDIRAAEPPVVVAGKVDKIQWNDVTADVIETVQKNESVYADKRHRSRAGYIDSGTDEKNLGNAFGIINHTDWKDLADAQQEEIIGKTANLLTAGSVSPATIQAVVIVQTIKSIDAPDGTLVVKPTYKIDGSVYRDAGKDPEKTITAADFDIKYFSDTDINDKPKPGYVYFDEITSELRALVTIKKINDASGIRLQLHSIQYY